ncbi:MAG: hypothetical protein D6761_13080 [Candidatus Dadabacteria bacterium]|nr:MAG: hypothetical protein D6761_13080 [Candidatus Dadabacteria bacterium]
MRAQAKLLLALLAGAGFLGACGVVEDLQDALSQVVVNTIGAIDESAAPSGEGLRDATSGSLEKVANQLPVLVPVPSDLFDSDASAGAPGLSQKVVSRTAWSGPVKAPDGTDGWYQKDYTREEQYQDAQGNQITATFNDRYFVKTDPPANIAAGQLSSVSVKKFFFGWQNQTPDSTKEYVLSTLEFFQPVGIPGGITFPLRTVGSFVYVQPATAQGEGARAEGEFEYAGVDLEFLLGTGTFATGYSNTNVGETFVIPLTGVSTYQSTMTRYTGQGGYIPGRFNGDRTEVDGYLTVTKLDAAGKGEFHLVRSEKSTVYQGSGTRDTSIDYLQEPAFTEGQVPPGDAWMADERPLPGGGNQTPRDGLERWSTTESEAEWTGQGDLSDVGGEDEDGTDRPAPNLSQTGYETYAATALSFEGDKMVDQNCTDIPRGSKCP